MNVEDISFSIGDIDEAIDIMREAARWLIDTGKPLWRLEDLTKEKLLKANKINDFYIFCVNNESAGTMILKWQDPFFWPNAKYGESGFIHKMSVRRKYSGTKISISMIEQAKRECQKRNIALLRLDCDAGREKLCSFYEKFGFTQVDRKMIGVFDTALYEYKIDLISK